MKAKPKRSNSLEGDMKKPQVKKVAVIQTCWGVWDSKDKKLWDLLFRTRHKAALEARHSWCNSEACVPVKLEIRYSVPGKEKP